MPHLQGMAGYPKQMLLRCADVAVFDKVRSKGHNACCNNCILILLRVMSKNFPNCVLLSLAHLAHLTSTRQPAKAPRLLQ